MIYNLNGIKLDLMDQPGSRANLIVAHEINNDDYNLDKVGLQPGDYVIDIGANTGMLALYLLKKYPGIFVVSFEASPVNYQNLLRNSQQNAGHKFNWMTFNMAVTSDARSIELNHPLVCKNSGSIDIYTKGNNTYTISSISLGQIFYMYIPDKVKLLKIDCEGSEYEILYNCSVKLFDRVEYLVAEFHKSSLLKGFTAKDLYDYCLKFFDKQHFFANQPGNVRLT